MQRLLEMIEHLGPFVSSKNNIIISTPEPSEISANTLVRVQGKFETGTYGDYAFRYNRMDMSGMPVRNIVWDDYADFAAMLGKINQTPLFTYTLGDGQNILIKQGFLLVQDIVNQPITIGSGEQQDLIIQASPNSYLYRGGLRIHLTRP